MPAGSRMDLPLAKAKIITNYKAAELFGLKVSLKKTEVLYQPAAQEVFHHPHITIGESELKLVQQFTYLGSIISSDSKIDKEIDYRLAKAYRAFGKLHKRVWSDKYLKRSTKICVYRAIVLSTLLYGSESWVIYRHHLHLLKCSHQHCLHSILNTHWSDYLTSVSVLEQAGVSSIEAMLMRTQLRCAGHVSRMEDHHLPKIVLCVELATSCHKRGALQRRIAALVDDRRVTDIIYLDLRKSFGTVLQNILFSKQEGHGFDGHTVDKRWLDGRKEVTQRWGGSGTNSQHNSSSTSSYYCSHVEREPSTSSSTVFVLEMSSEYGMEYQWPVEVRAVNCLTQLII
ncbi:hypothetical protein WISP_61900 [Willisornis vidua]|uniref:Uncharacterized protein n=1 Tax=Willisornis vidua TaxID=1566151 RepID=A0ABQ9DAT0_9PASS|nr:hypothetical protein WISP_61900 [Willisornis vidua]